MIKLNLISPSQQNYLKIKAIYVAVENILGWLVIIGIIMAIILIPVNDNLSILNEQLTYEKGRTVASNQLLTDKIKELKSKIDILASLQASNYSWVNLLTELSALTPAEVSLIQFNADLSSHQFALQGFAKKRDNLLSFKERLGQSSIFADIQSPLTDILKREEITFEIKGSFK